MSVMEVLEEFDSDGKSIIAHCDVRLSGLE
jgi:hypothetical protein